MTEGDTIHYVDSAAVRRALPSALELIDLAEVALRSLVSGAEVPEKVVLVPGPSGVFAHAMPARLTASLVPGGAGAADLPGGAGEAGVPREVGAAGGPAGDRTGDLLGMKWIAGGPGNRAAGLPALAALIILADPLTGMPRAILEGGVITAARTAALSGVAVRLLVPEAGGGRAGARLAVIVGAGAQGRAHAEMLGALLPGVELAIHDRHPERAAALAADASRMAGVSGARQVADAGPDLRRADVVVTATSLGATRPVLGPGHVRSDALVVPVDYGAFVTPELVRVAGAFLVDDRERFESNRRSGRLAGWPDPTASLGELLIRARPSETTAAGARGARGAPPTVSGQAPVAGVRRAREPGRRGAPASGLRVALHQGPAISDLIVANAVLRRAEAEGLALDLVR